MSNVKIYFFWVIAWFTILFIASIPFTYHIIPPIHKVTLFILTPCVKWMGVILFQEQETVILSDSRGLYIAVFLLFLISIITAFITLLWDREKTYYAKLKYLFHSIISYYLSLQLFKYGVDKLFKHQFYLPEPNLLFTPMGQLSKDILFWSTMGTSYSYSLFSGIIEIIPAFLLLYKRTRLLGALLAFGVLLNVIMINIGFNISVKVYSTFLLFISVIIIYPNYKNLIAFFWQHKIVQPNLWSTKMDKSRFYAIGKSLIITLIFFESLFIYAKTNNYNDDKAKRPYLHGAYQIENVKGDRFLDKDIGNLKRLFVHRGGYLIIQDKEDKMHDYKMEMDKISQKIRVTDHNQKMYEFVYEQTNDTLKFLEKRGAETVLKMTTIHWKKLPLLHQSTYWTVEEFE